MGDETEPHETFIEIRWQVGNGMQPESGSWRRVLTSGIGFDDVTLAVHNAINTIRERTGAAKP